MLSKSDLLDIIYPPHCMACGTLLSEKKEFCKSCAETLHRVELKEVYNINNRYNAATGAFYYNGSGKIMLLRYKYSGKRYLAGVFAKYMAQAVEKQYSGLKFDVITYVPMTKLEKAKRHFNQSELLAKQLSKILDVECKSLLKKTKNTPKQHKLDIETRTENLKNCFAANKKESIKGKMVLLVDDVKTTGTTLNECSKVLRRAGAKAICCVTATFA